MMLLPSGEADYSEIPKMVLSADKSVRFCAVIDRLGRLGCKKFREDITEPIMSEEDNEKYALLTTMRRRPRIPWSQKIGKTHYFVLRSDKLVQATIPLSDSYLLLVYLDVNNNANYDQIIMNKILPAIGLP